MIRSWIVSGDEGFSVQSPLADTRGSDGLDDAWFYVDPQGNHAFDTTFDFAESFHQDRALVKQVEQLRILDTHGEVVKELDYDPVIPQSPWCWQVTKIENDTYTHGFVDLDGTSITERIYDDVGYYDPDVKRIRVSGNDRYGFLDERAKIAIPVKYAYAEIFNHGKARVILDGRSFTINPDGVEVPE